MTALLRSEQKSKVDALDDALRAGERADKAEEELAKAREQLRKMEERLGLQESTEASGKTIVEFDESDSDSDSDSDSVSTT